MNRLIPVLKLPQILLKLYTVLIQPLLMSLSGFIWGTTFKTAIKPEICQGFI